MLVECTYSFYRFCNAGQTYKVLDLDFNHIGSNLVSDIFQIEITDNDNDKMWYPIKDAYFEFKVVRR